ncbi:Flagellar motor switch protein [Rubellimicrobium thermophilum DSM 16684]|uniref:Flagellar motor switch protein FliG n=1 Tax=Rubellimicrobium thermophilum DSM 16684 TaxID=1123069 RepID=S9R5N2_9RHOB|nr:FliG C-terminal domain-containing protein [Rubellimicrobium thermophilum]EPX87217.1 Flagellar motor switch protein [Rubellimicrobium thermophilum DSM 16684]
MPSPAPAAALDARRKAAIVVQFLLSDGVRLPIDTLPEETQIALAREMAAIGVVDRATLDAVLTEFADKLESLGLAAPATAQEALAALQGILSPAAARRLLENPETAKDPWAVLAALPVPRLAELLSAESPEIAAIALSKIPVARAAEALTRLPGERARRVAHAVSRTAGVSPAMVQEIGRALAATYGQTPEAAFADKPGDRLGAVLNTAPQTAREALLEGLEGEDPAFAAEVRRAIFTFAHLPRRLRPADVPRLLRGVEPRVIATALVAARAGSAEETAAADFLLAALPQRLADSLREEMEGIERVRPADGEAAQAAIVAAARERAAAGEIELLQPEETA